MYTLFKLYINKNKFKIIKITSWRIEIEGTRRDGQISSEIVRKLLFTKSQSYTFYKAVILKINYGSSNTSKDYWTHWKKEVVHTAPEILWFTWICIPEGLVLIFGVGTVKQKNRKKHPLKLPLPACPLCLLFPGTGHKFSHSQKKTFFLWCFKVRQIELNIVN